METIIIECEHMVCINVGNGMYQNVVFNPTKETTDAIVSACLNQSSKHIKTKDKAGDHISKNRHQFIRSRQSYGTIIFTTSEYA